MNAVQAGTNVNITHPTGEADTLPVSIALDLTGYTARWEIAIPGAPLLLTDANGGVTFVTRSPGAMTLNISAARGLALPIGVYSYDFWIISSTGDPLQICTGSFVVTPRVTPLS